MPEATSTEPDDDDFTDDQEAAVDVTDQLDPPKFKIRINSHHL